MKPGAGPALERATPDPPVRAARLAPFAALSASYFAHIGFFNPYLPLWLKELGYGFVAIGLLTSVQSGTRLFAPYVWGWFSDHTGERVKLLRYSALVALVLSIGLWFEWSLNGLLLLLLLMFAHTSGMMPMSEAAMAHLVSQGGAFDTRRYGRVRLWGSLGFLATVFTAGAWFEHFGMKHFPAWTTGSLAAVTLALLGLLASRTRQERQLERRVAGAQRSACGTGGILGSPAAGRVARGERGLAATAFGNAAAAPRGGIHRAGGNFPGPHCAAQAARRTRRRAASGCRGARQNCGVSRSADARAGRRARRIADRVGEGGTARCAHRTDFP